MDRVSFLMRVKDGYQDEYIRRHRKVWPEVLAEQQRAGIKKMAIYMKGPDLFLYMEVEDYAKAVRLLSQSPVALSWEEYMAPIMADVGNRAVDPANAYPASLPEVFFWEPATHDGNGRMSVPEEADLHSPAAPHFELPNQAAVNRDSNGWSHV
jgi:L-rhamnose mutarotase